MSVMCRTDVPLSRGMVESLFTKEHVDGLRPSIQQTVDSLLDSMLVEGGEKPVDVVDKFALPVASHVSFLHMTAQ
jgi:nitric oxide reductase